MLILFHVKPPLPNLGNTCTMFSHWTCDKTQELKDAAMAAGPQGTALLGQIRSQ